MPGLARILAAHPFVDKVEEGGSCALTFASDGCTRRVLVGDREAPVRGLIETMDNNPIVCADAVSVPTPAATLALIALSPLIRAGLVFERPNLVYSAPADPEDIDACLEAESWTEGALTHSEPMGLGSVLACTAMAAIATPDRLEDIDGLYEEFYGRALFVRRDEASDWDVRLVSGRAHALYRLRIAPDEPNSLLTIQAMADLEGKCGAAQIVHAMNVMQGWEESLGIEG